MKILKGSLYLSLDQLLINTTYSIFFFKSSMINTITEAFFIYKNYPFLKILFEALLSVYLVLTISNFSYNPINNKANFSSFFRGL